MALNFDLNSMADESAVIEVVCKFDECLDMTKEEYDSEYIANGADPQYLRLKEGSQLSDCTLFVLKKNLDWQGHERLMKKQFEIDPVTKQPVANPAFILTDIQQSLVDIKNPEGAKNKIDYKQDRPGMASRALVVALQNTGVLTDLFSARANAQGAKSSLIEKKNSLPS